MLIRDEEGIPVPIQDGALQLEEARRYQLILGSPDVPAAAWLGERPLPWNDALPGFPLQVGYWAGSTTLRVRREGQEQKLRVEVLPRAEKLSEAEWLALLTDLEQWLPGLSVGLEGGHLGNVAHAGTRVPTLASALLPLVPALLDAVKALIRSPRERSVGYRGTVRMHAVQRADGEVIRWLSCHPEARLALDRWYTAQVGGLDPHLPQQLSRDTLDHPANRYIAWLLRRVARVLSELGDVLQRYARRPGLSPEIKAWCEARAASALLHTEALEGLRRRSFLRELRPSPPTDAALLIIQDDPLYARVHALARRFLSPRFQLPADKDALGAPIKPSYTLYELWTFLATQRALATALPEYRWSWDKEAAPTLLAGLGGGTGCTAIHPKRSRLRLWFNLTFSGWLAHGESDRYSISKERRPDLVITWESEEGEKTWLFLDAKYRVQPGALADSFSSLHLYRDSLRWETYGGQARGGLLLVPKMASGGEEWFSQKFRERFGIGALCLTPGEEIPKTLAQWVLDTLAWK